MPADRDTGDLSYAKIGYDRVYGFQVGGIQVIIGRTRQDEKSGPVVYGAALSENDLRRKSCGYGASESEAVADLFRLMH
jgi:hypothetical protein